MDHQNLRAFVSIATAGSFSAAAEVLHLTQPVISKRIHNLEQQTGCRLLDRIGRRMVLTEAGHTLLPLARHILQLLDEAQRTLDDLNGPVRGTLKLATSHHIGLHRIPAVLKRFRQAWPEVRLAISFLNSRESHEAVLSGEVELGITTEEDLAAEQIVSARIWKDDLEFVVSLHHPLAGAGNLTLGDLTRYEAILPEARFTTGRIVRELFEQRGLALRVDDNLSTDYLETLKAMVSISEAWSALPHTMLPDPGLARLDIRDVRLSRYLTCIRHRDRTLSRAATAFLDVLDTMKDSEEPPT